MYLLESSAFETPGLVGMDETALSSSVQKTLSQFYGLSLLFRIRGCFNLFKGSAKPSELPVVSLIFHCVSSVTLE